MRQVIAMDGAGDLVPSFSNCLGACACEPFLPAPIKWFPSLSTVSRGQFRTGSTQKEILCT